MPNQQNGNQQKDDRNPSDAGAGAGPVSRSDTTSPGGAGSPGA